MQGNKKKGNNIFCLENVKKQRGIQAGVGKMGLSNFVSSLVGFSIPAIIRVLKRNVWRSYQPHVVGLCTLGCTTWGSVCFPAKAIR